MAKLLQLRRGDTSAHSTFTGAEAEVTVDTSKQTIVVHNGNGSAGNGVALAKESDVDLKAPKADPAITGTATFGSSTADSLIKVYGGGADNVLEAHQEGTGAQLTVQGGGNLTTAGNIQTGSDPTSGANAGCKVNGAGYVYVSTASGNPLLRGYETSGGSGSQNVTIMSSGAVELAGQIDASYYVTDPNYSTNSGKAYLGGNDTNGLRIKNKAADTDMAVIGWDGGATFSSDITINADNKKLKLGAGSDLELYHDGTNSYIDSHNSGLYIRVADAATGNIYIQPNSAEHSIVCNEDGTVDLYHNGSKKVETSSTGMTVTGAIQLDGNVNCGEGYTDSNEAGTWIQAGGGVYPRRGSGSTDPVFRGGSIGASSNVDILANGNATFAGTVTASAGVLGVGDAVLANDQTWTGAQRGAISGLTDASTIAVPFAVGNNFSVTLAGNRTLGQPSDQVAGQSGSIFVTQDGTGSRTLAYHADWKWAGGSAPTLSTAANTVDRIDYIVAASNKVHAVATLAVA